MIAMEKRRPRRLPSCVPRLLSCRQRVLAGCVLAAAATASAFTAREMSVARGDRPATATAKGGDGPTQATGLSEDLRGDDYGADYDPCAVDSRRFFLRTSAAAAVAALCAGAEEARAEADVPPEGAIEGGGGLGSSAAVASSDGAAAPALDFDAILKKSAKRALGGGKAGAAAAVVQVCALMWLRTAMNYQYRYGGDLRSSLRTLMAEGGLPRLYQGFPFALFQGPLTRFGDTAANVGVLALLDAIPEAAGLPLPLRTAAGSATAGLWRIFLMPLDTSKTAMQVEGAEGLTRLRDQVMEGGPSPLYQGALASAAATAAGHFPWFLTYNFLNDYLPPVSNDEVLLLLARSAFLGLGASCVSDCVSNSLRVIKTTKQTAMLGAAAPEAEDAALVGDSDRKKEETEGGKEITYREALDLVLEEDGVAGLFGRGLKTRLLTNAIQGSLFSVLWKYFQTVGV